MTALQPIAGTAASSQAGLSAAATIFAADRNLSPKTLERLGVASGMAFFPELNRKSEGTRPELRFTSSSAQ